MEWEDLKFLDSKCILAICRLMSLTKLLVPRALLLGEFEDCIMTEPCL